MSSGSGCQASAQDCARRRACGLAWRLRVVGHRRSLTISRSPAVRSRPSPRREPIRPPATTFWSAWRFRGRYASLAFAHGVLEENRWTVTVRTRTGTHSLLDPRGFFVSGVSGGAITAAYYGLKKREALADFRERFLLRNAERASTPASIRSALSKRSAAASTTSRCSRAGSMKTCSTAQPSRISARHRARASGSTPRHLQPYAVHLRRGDLHLLCAATSRLTRSPTRWRPLPRCPSSLLRR